MQPQWRDVERSIKAYWFEDGLAELIAGALFLIIGLYFVLVEVSAQARWGGLLQAAFIVIVLGAGFAGRALIMRLKDQYVYPRTGFVEYRLDGRALRWRRVIAGLTAALVAAILIVFLPIGGWVDWVVALTSLVVGAVLIGQARSAGHTGFFILGIASLLLGILLPIIGFLNGFALGLYYGSLGLAFIVSGAIAFQRFLHENPVRLQDHDGH